MPAPIWVMGPSRPALPPLEMVSTEVKPLMMGTSGRMYPPLLWKALMVESVPSVPPVMVSGMNLLISQPVSRPVAVVAMGMTQPRSSVSCAWKSCSPAGCGEMTPASLAE